MTKLFNTNIINFVYDNSHGWGLIHVDTLKKYNLLDKISEYSYCDKDQDMIACEEDCDFPKVLKALDRSDIKYNINEVDVQNLHGENSNPRNWNRYNVDYMVAKHG